MTACLLKICCLLNLVFISVKSDDDIKECPETFGKFGTTASKCLIKDEYKSDETYCTKLYAKASKETENGRLICRWRRLSVIIGNIINAIGGGGI